jgi:GntR family transcriptional regulator, transcriptional repressor for pyruvate dehydrogenase complex
MAPLSRSENRRPVYEEVCEQIHTLIRRGELAVGAKLPPERMLAAQFKVSRNSVREALRVLAENRVVESRHGDGTYIRSLEDEDRLNTLGPLIEKQRTRVGEIFQFRRILEPQIAFLAAQRITPQELKQLKVLIFEQKRRRVLGQTDEDLDAEFHLSVARATKNAVIIEVLKALTGILNETRSVCFQGPERQFISLRTHILIVDALERQDPQAAWEAMEQHLVEIEQTVLEGAPNARNID